MKLLIEIKVCSLVSVLMPVLMLLPACASLKDNAPVSLHTHLYERGRPALRRIPCRKPFNPGISEQDILEAEKKLYPSYSYNGASRDDYRPNLAIASSRKRPALHQLQLGFLKALDPSGALAKADILSTVSGGSYGAYWFITKLHKFSGYTNPRRRAS
jgi:hypothetical protein